MWRVPLCLVTVCFLVQINAAPDISLEDLLERLETLEAWKRETEIEVSTLRETVAKQGVIIKNLERDLAVQANLTAKLKSCIQDKNQNAHEHQSETEDETISEGQVSDSRIRANDLHNQIPIKPSTVSKREIGGSVAFTAYRGTDVTVGIKQRIRFNQIITNDGNAYNVLTGVFTAPQTGLYLFSFFLAERSAGDTPVELYADLVVNSQIVVGAVAETQHDNQDTQGGNTAVVRLNQGDAVWVEALKSGTHVEGSTSLRSTTFTGVYLYA